MVWAMRMILTIWATARIRAVGELLQNQYKSVFPEWNVCVRERMTTQDLEGVSAQSLINIKPVTAAVKGILQKFPAVTVHGSE